jgi:membrane fusion protein (multidrug efflux system)
VVLAALAYGLWYVLVGHYVETDNAYVGADTASVTSMVAAQVAGVPVQDTQVVKKAMCWQLDDRDARIALAQAEAEPAKARRMYGQTAATSTALAAQVAAREADITRARAQPQPRRSSPAARIDLDRRRRLAPNGAVSGEELTSATNAFAAAQAISNSPALVAQAASNAWRGQRATRQQRADRGHQRRHRARSPGRRASRGAGPARSERTVVRAPVDGVVTRRNVQVGQRVAPGGVLMLVVPVGQLYVDANFKEGQLPR